MLLSYVLYCVYYVGPGGPDAEVGPGGENEDVLRLKKGGVVADGCHRLVRLPLRAKESDQRWPRYPLRGRRYFHTGTEKKRGSSAGSRRSL